MEVLLASQEAWAVANLEVYPACPAAVAFTAKIGPTDEARRLAFLSALRIAPNSKVALYTEPDPHTTSTTGNLLPCDGDNTLPEPQHSTYKFVALKSGDPVAPLSVVASAADEPDYGLDINL